MTVVEGGGDWGRFEERLGGRGGYVKLLWRRGARCEV